MLELDTTLLKDLYQPSSNKPLPRRAKTLIGQKFERLTPYGFMGATASGDAIWLCRCDCGRFILARSTDLRRKKARSCGNDLLPWQPCYQRHQRGQTKSIAYRRWSDMLTRATNPNYKQAEDYSLRGITVCDRWRSFENFLADMGEPPSSVYSIERRNNDLGYSPENCSWELKKVQARNTRANRYITIGDDTYCAAEWAERRNLPYALVMGRLQKNWTPEEALEMVPRFRTTGVRTRWITAFGETLPMSEWVKRTGIKKSAIRSRLKRGWTPERTLSKN